MLRNRGMAVSLACVIALSAAACSHRQPPDPPPPDGTQVIAPGPDVPAAIAAFSGSWHGYWDGKIESLLVVERISRAGEAAGVYAWSIDPDGAFQAGSMTFQGTIASGVLSFGSRVRFDFAMKPDGTLFGQRTIDGVRDDDVVMTRVP